MTHFYVPKRKKPNPIAAMNRKCEAKTRWENGIRVSQCPNKATIMKHGLLWCRACLRKKESN